jgi:hypothetical protein
LQQPADTIEARTHNTAYHLRAQLCVVHDEHRRSNQGRATQQRQPERITFIGQCEPCCRVKHEMRRTIRSTEAPAGRTLTTTRRPMSASTDTGTRSHTDR